LFFSLTAHRSRVDSKNSNPQDEGGYISIPLLGTEHCDERIQQPAKYRWFDDPRHFFNNDKRYSKDKSAANIRIKIIGLLNWFINNVMAPDPLWDFIRFAP
jgi:hypothetical protein